MKLPLQIPSAVTTSTMDARLMQCDEPVTMHTLAAYGTALSLGADWIEPDVVASSDRDLWVLHTVDLNVTTSVHEVFGSSKEPWHSPRENRTGYWSFNFTSEELTQLTICAPAIARGADCHVWRVVEDSKIGAGIASFEPVESGGLAADAPR